MTTTTLEIVLLAGVLEGEGSFFIKKGSPCIALQMTDRDVVERCAKLMGVQMGAKPRQPKGKDSYKPVWHMRVYGTRAVEWMLTVYVLLAERRRAKIRSVIETWKASKAAPRASRGTHFMALCHPDKPRVADGLCRNCYMRKYRRARNWRTSKDQRLLEQDPTYVSKRVKAMATCHPDRLAQAKGLCSSCYMKQWSAEHPEQRIKKNAKALARYHARKKRPAGGPELFPPTNSSTTSSLPFPA
jgi:hypothetical protein